MRGEFIGVWSETWREIWLPLIDYERVPDDVFCELYRELAKALKDPSDDDATLLAINDAIHLREAFEQAVQLADPSILLERVREVFTTSAATEKQGATERRGAVEGALATLIGDSSIAHNLLSIALSEIAQSPQKRAEARERAIERVINDPIASRDTFEQAQRENFSGERKLVEFLEAAYDVIDGIGGDELSNRYFNLLTAFIEKFSLRYDLRRPCTLCPTLPGVFASLVRELHVLAQQDEHLRALMREFEEAVRDLRLDCSDGRIKTCIQKQVNLVEALARVCPGVTGTTLGAICEQVNTWPHEKLKAAMKDLYGFASEYPGIRHGGTPANALRPVEMRDMIAMSILLAGFTPYLSNGLNLETIYRGA
jgi:hypothetical protein